MKKELKKFQKKNNSNGKIKNGFEKFWEKNRKAKKAAVCFMVFLFAGYMISRGVYAALLPKVSVESPAYRNLVHQVVIYGSLSTKRELTLYGEEGLRVERIYVREGEKLGAGDPILQYDLRDVDKKLETLYLDAEKMDIQMGTMEFNSGLQEAARKKEKSRAQEDLARTQERSAEDEAAAQVKLEEARDELAQLPDRETYIEEKCAQEEQRRLLQEKTSELEASSAQAENDLKRMEELKKELDEVKETFEKYKKSLKKSLAVSWAKENATAGARETVLLDAENGDGQVSDRSVYAEELVLASSTAENSGKDTDSYPDKDSYIKAKIKEDAKYQELLAKIENLEKSIQSAESGSKSVGSLKKELSEVRRQAMRENYALAWEDEKKALERAVREQEAAAASVARQTQDSLRYAQRLAEDASAEPAKDCTLDLMELERSRLKKEMETYETIKAQDGTVFSDSAGMVTRMLVSEGGRVTDSGVCRIADASEGYYFEGVISKDDREYVTVEDTAEISIGHGNGRTSADVLAVTELPEGESYTVSFLLDTEAGNIGDTGRAVIEKQEEVRSLSVPVSALREEQGTKYVLVVDERQTILGTELVADRRNVEIVSLNAKYAAVNGAGLSKEDQVIVSATKPVMSGDKLRLLGQ